MKDYKLKQRNLRASHALKHLRTFVVKMVNLMTSRNLSNYVLNDPDVQHLVVKITRTYLLTSSFMTRRMFF